MTDLILPGDIPGLLRRGSPVLVDREGDWEEANSLVLQPGRRTAITRRHPGDACVGVSAQWVDMSSIHLDLSDPTGRCHAAWWLMRYKRPAMVETYASWGPYHGWQGIFQPTLHTGDGVSLYSSDVKGLCPDLNWYDHRGLSDGSKWVYAEALRRVVLHVAVSKAGYRMCKKGK